MSHRNEAARARHRRQLKQQYSLSTIPLPDVEEERLRLDNHFGWTVQQKCLVGEGEFPPYLMACFKCDKPEIRVGESDNVTYVLYVQGGDYEDTKPALIEPEFKVSESILKSTTPKPQTIVGKKESYGERSYRTKKKKRLISDFYYIPVKERATTPTGRRGRSPRSTPSNQSAGDASLNEDGKDLDVSKVGSARKKKTGSRSKPKSWQLRAGAEFSPDRGDGSDLEEEETTEEESSESEPEEYDVLENNNVKTYDCVSCCIQSPKEVLMDSGSKANKYLFLPTERYERKLARLDYNFDQP